MSTVRFEESALAGHGTGLADTTPAAVAPVAGAPGADPVSVAAVAALTAHAQALGLVVEHAAALRAVGGAAVAGTAGVLGGIDRGNAATIAAVANGAPPGAAPAPPPLSAAALPSVPSPPAIPTLPAAPVMPGEQWSTLIHGGPGSAGLRSFADALRAHANTLTDTAGQVHGHGRGIDEHWQDGVQQAGANTAHHGRWLERAAAQANTIAAAADQVAEHYDTARTAVPPPNEFTAARQDILTAQAAANPPALAQAVQRYSWLQTQTHDAVLTGYHPGATSALTGLPQPLPAAPPITHDGSAVPLDEHTGGDGDTPQEPDKPWEGKPHPRTADDVRDILKQLEPGNNKPHRQIQTPEEMKEFWDWLTGDAKDDPNSRVPWPRKVLDDGTILQDRPTSRSGGPTIESIFPGAKGDPPKVHLPLPPPPPPPLEPPTPTTAPTISTLPPWLQNPAITGTPVPTQPPSLLPGTTLPHLSDGPVSSGGGGSSGPGWGAQFGHDLADAGEKIAAVGIVGLIGIGTLLGIVSAPQGATP